MPNHTQGNHYNCPCPYCGKINNYPSAGVVVPFLEIRSVVKPCRHCEKPITYHLSWEIFARAFTEDTFESELHSTLPKEKQECDPPSSSSDSSPSLPC